MKNPVKVNLSPQYTELLTVTPMRGIAQASSLMGLSNFVNGGRRNCYAFY